MSAKSRNRLGPQPTDVVWHYTDAAGALGILTSKQFWATHARHMNDGEEVQRLFSYAVSELHKERRSTAFQGAEAMVDKAISDFGSWLQVNYFVVSFSTDSDSLSQWRAYGGAKQGFALGFSKSALSALGGSWRFEPCVYSEARGHAIARKVIREKMAEIQLGLWDHIPEESRLTHTIYSPLISLAPFFKDPAFIEEREWRLVAGPISGEVAAFRTSARGISPYFPVAIPQAEDGLLHLREVMIGPGATDETVHGLEMLTGWDKAIGHQLPVFTSTAPYRI